MFTREYQEDSFIDAISKIFWVLSWHNMLKMSDEEMKKSDASKGTSDSAENPRLCSFSIERLLAPSKIEEEENKFSQHTDLSSFCQKSEW